MAENISPRQFSDADGVEDWSVVADGANACYRTGSFEVGARLVQAISELPAVKDHPPDIDMRPGAVTVRLITVTDRYFGMSRRNIELARSISEVARGLGLTADTSAVQSLLIIPGATSTADILPFWRTALGYVPRPDSPDEDLIDPHGRGPSFWFERMEEPRSDGGGSIHLAVWVPYEQAESRINAALAAGGHMVRDTSAPAWWTLADKAGNELDVATTSARA